MVYSISKKMKKEVVDKIRSARFIFNSADNAVDAHAASDTFDELQRVYMQFLGDDAFDHYRFLNLGGLEVDDAFLKFASKLVDIYADMPLDKHAKLDKLKGWSNNDIIGFITKLYSSEGISKRNSLLNSKNCHIYKPKAFNSESGFCTVYNDYLLGHPIMLVERSYTALDFVIPAREALQTLKTDYPYDNKTVVAENFMIWRALKMLNKEGLSLQCSLMHTNIVNRLISMAKEIQADGYDKTPMGKAALICFADQIMSLSLAQDDEVKLVHLLDSDIMTSADTLPESWYEQVTNDAKCLAKIKSNK